MPVDISSTGDRARASVSISALGAPPPPRACRTAVLVASAAASRSAAALGSACSSAAAAGISVTRPSPCLAGSTLIARYPLASSSRSTIASASAVATFVSASPTVASVAGSIPYPVWSP